LYYYNTNQYLSTLQDFWALSPNSINNNFAAVWNGVSTGYLSNFNVPNILGVLVVINLKSNVEVTGTGSSTDPFKVVS